MAVNDQLNFQTHQYVSPTDGLQDTLGAGGIFAQTLNALSKNSELQLSDYTNLINMQRQDVQDQRNATKFDQEQKAYRQQQAEVDGQYKMSDAFMHPLNVADKNNLANADYKNVLSGNGGTPIYTKDGKTTDGYSQDVNGAIIPQNSFLQQLITKTGPDGKSIPSNISENDVQVPTDVGYGKDEDGNNIITTKDDKGNVVPLTSLQAYVRNSNNLRTGTDNTGSKFVFDDGTGKWYGANTDGTKGVLVDDNRQKNVTETMQDVPINQNVLKKTLINVVDNEAKDPIFNESKSAALDRVIQDYNDRGEQIPLSVTEAKMHVDASNTKAEADKTAYRETLNSSIHAIQNERTKASMEALKNQAEFVLKEIGKKSGVSVSDANADGGQTNAKNENLESKVKSEALIHLLQAAKTSDNPISDVAQNIKNNFNNLVNVQNYDPYDVEAAMMANITSTTTKSGTNDKGKPSGDYLKTFSNTDMSGYVPRTAEQIQLAYGISVPKNSTSTQLSKVYKSIADVSSKVVQSQLGDYDNQIAELRQKLNDIDSSSGQVQYRKAIQDSNKVYTDMFPGFKNIDQVTRDNDDKNNALILQNALKEGYGNINSAVNDDGNGGTLPKKLAVVVSDPSKAQALLPNNQGSVSTGNAKFDSRIATAGVDPTVMSNLLADPYALQQAISFNETGLATKGGSNSDPSYSKKTPALGKYQFLPSTLHGLPGMHSITDDEFLSHPAMQEKAYDLYMNSITKTLSATVPNWNNLSVGTQNLFKLRSWNSGPGGASIATAQEDPEYIARAFNFLSGKKYKDIKSYWSSNPDKVAQNSAYIKKDSTYSSRFLDSPMIQRAVNDANVAEENYQKSKQLDWFGNTITKLGAAFDSYNADNNVDKLVNSIHNKQQNDMYSAQISNVQKQIQNLSNNNQNGQYDMDIQIQKQKLDALQKQVYSYNRIDDFSNNI